MRARPVPGGMASFPWLKTSTGKSDRYARRDWYYRWTCCIQSDRGWRRRDRKNKRRGIKRDHLITGRHDGRIDFNDHRRALQCRLQSSVGGRRRRRRQRQNLLVAQQVECARRALRRGVGGSWQHVRAARGPPDYVVVGRRGAPDDVVGGGAPDDVVGAQGGA